MLSVFHSLGRWADALNRLLASTQLVSLRRRGFERATDEMTRDANSPLPVPATLHEFLDYVRIGWRMALFYSGLFGVGVAFLGDRIGGTQGRWIGLSIGAFPVTVCIVGEFDLIWRLLVVSAAERRYVAAGETFDEPTQRLMRIAKANDASLLVQVGVALAVSLTIALLG